MSTHTRHPDTHAHGLADDCPRCNEHADHPFESLDDGNLRALVRRTRLWMENAAYARSENELRAMRIVEVALRQADRPRKAGGVVSDVDVDIRQADARALLDSGYLLVLRSVQDADAGRLLLALRDEHKATVAALAVVSAQVRQTHADVRALLQAEREKPQPPEPQSLKAGE